MPIKLLLSCLLMLCSTPSYAYIGPGLGAGAIAAVVGVILSIVVAIFAVTYYPIKRAFKKRRAEKESIDQGADKETAINSADKSKQD